jgi:hypothetical protein
MHPAALLQFSRALPAQQLLQRLTVGRARETISQSRDFETKLCPGRPLNRLCLAFKQPSRNPYSLGISRRTGKEANVMHTDYQIDALLARGGEAGSIFDRLMAMPRPAADAANEWDRAVIGRLETHLARRMRDMLDGAGDGRKDAA